MSSTSVPTTTRGTPDKKIEEQKHHTSFRQRRILFPRVEGLRGQQTHKMLRKHPHKYPPKLFSKLWQKKTKKQDVLKTYPEGKTTSIIISSTESRYHIFYTWYVLLLPYVAHYTPRSYYTPVWRTSERLNEINLEFFWEKRVHWTVDRMAKVPSRARSACSSSTSSSSTN